MSHPRKRLYFRHLGAYHKHIINKKLLNIPVPGIIEKMEKLKSWDRVGPVISLERHIGNY